jgi:hypothetical protein
MNKKIRTVLVVSFATGFLAESAWADEIWNFTRITCATELNYFEASAIEINSGSNEESDFMNENQKKISKKYGLMGEQIQDAQECKLKDANLKIQIKYRPASETGMCGPQPDAILKLWIDDKLVVDLNSFNDCSADGFKGINSIGFKISKKYWDGESILYFKEKDSMGNQYPCVIWLDEKKQNISSNYCNESYKNKSLPITNDYITKITTTNKN